MAYTKQEKETMFKKVIEYISNGMSLRTALKQDDVFSQKVWDVLVIEEEKSIQYTRAREARADGIFEDMFDIADDGTNDYTKKDIGEGIEIEVLNSEHIQRSRLRIDTRKWALSKMNPKKYGDKTEIEHSGEIKGTEPKINLIVEGKTFNLKEKSKE